MAEACQKQIETFIAKLQQTAPEELDCYRASPLLELLEDWKADQLAYFGELIEKQ